MNSNQSLVVIATLGAMFVYASKNNQTLAQQEYAYGYYSSYGSPGGYGITPAQDVPGYYNTNYQSGVYSPFAPE